MPVNARQIASGPVCVLLAALLWGLSGGIAALLMAFGWDALVVAFYRGAIGLLLVLGWLLLQPRDSGLSQWRLWFWSAVAGIGVAANFSFYFLSIEAGSVAVAATLMYCAPLFVYLISFACGLEKPTLAKWAAMIVVMVGVVLLTGIYAQDAILTTRLGITAGLLSAAAYAVFIFGFKYAVPYGSPQAILSIALMVMAGTLIWLIDSEQALAVGTATSWPLFVVLGIFGGGIAFILYIAGLKYTLPSVAAVVAMVEPVTAALFGLVILNQSLTGIQLVGMGLILITVSLLSLYASRRQSVA